MRDLVRPLFPRGYSLDAQLLFNFRLKAKRILSSKAGEVCDMTVTTDDEALLLSTDALDAESPGYVTDVFRLFNELIEQALGDEGDLAQIETYLNLLATHDPSFKYRRVQDENGNMTGYVWQTGVISRCWNCLP
jgi:hypothetical protein